MASQEELKKIIEEASNSYFESVKRVSELRKAYEEAQFERDKRRVLMEVSIYEHNKANGKEYTIKLGSSTFDVVDVKPNGSSYDITYSAKNGELKTVTKTIMPQIKYVAVPDNVQYEF